MKNQLISDEARNLNSNPQSSEEKSDGGSGGYFGEIQEQNSHDQLPNVESYKVTVGYENPSKKSGMKIVEKLRRLSEGSSIEEEINPSFRQMDPPEQHSEDWSGLSKDPSGETFVGDCFGEEVDEGRQRHLVDTEDSTVLFSKPHHHVQPTPKNRFCWKFCAQITFGTLFVVLCSTIIVMTSHMHSWTKGGSDVHTREFVQGETKEYLTVRNYLLNVGMLPYNSIYDKYDPNSIDAVPTASAPQPLAKQEVLRNKISPQYLAAQWLAHGDGSFKSVPTINHKEYNQRYAMAVIYFALGGNQWTRSYNFMSSGHICTWKEEYNLQAIAEAATSEANSELASLADIHGDGWMDGQTVIHGVHDCVKDEEGNLYPKALYLRKYPMFVNLESHMKPLT